MQHRTGRRASGLAVGSAVELAVQSVADHPTHARRLSRSRDTNVEVRSALEVRREGHPVEERGRQVTEAEPGRGNGKVRPATVEELQVAEFILVAGRAGRAGPADVADVAGLPRHPCPAKLGNEVGCRQPAPRDASCGRLRDRERGRKCGRKLCPARHPLIMRAPALRRARTPQPPTRAPGAVESAAAQGCGR